MVVGSEGSGWSGLVGGFVVPDDSGEGEESLGDPGPDTVGFAVTVAFEVIELPI